MYFNQKAYLCLPLLGILSTSLVMTKAELVNEISTKTGIEKVAVQQAVESMMKVIRNSLINNENVYLRGFGSFIVKKRAKKTGRIITKNASIEIPEHFIPAFKPAKTFTERVKNAHHKKNHPSQ